MKHLLITAFVLFTAFTTMAQTAATPAQPVTVATPAYTIVYVNSDSLINNYDYYKAVKLKFQTLTAQAQTEISTKGAAFQKEVAAYQKGASALNLVQRTATEKRLAKKQQDLQQLSQNTGKQLQDVEAAQNEALYNKISAFLKVYAKNKGYKLVLTYSKTNPSMLYGDESLDITKDVIAGLNDDFKKNPN